MFGLSYEIEVSTMPEDHMGEVEVWDFATDTLKSACEELAPLAMKIVPLEVAGAYHSRLMRPAGEAFLEYLNSVPMHAPNFPVVHNVTGTEADATSESIRKRLAEQVYSPVRWENCCRVQFLASICSRALSRNARRSSISTALYCASRISFFSSVTSIFDKSMTLP